MIRQTFHFGFRSSEWRLHLQLLLLSVTEILETSIRIFEERFGRSTRQRTRLQESLFLLLMFVDQLKDQSDTIVVRVVEAGAGAAERCWTRVSGKPIVFAFVLAFETVEDRTNLKDFKLNYFYLLQFKMLNYIIPIFHQILHGQLTLGRWYCIMN